MINGISVVIPNYNGISLFPHTLHTVKLALKNQGLPHEIIISDDCSTDGSVNYLAEKHPDVIVVKNMRNSGFSVTCNAGVRTAAYNKILLLNSDVKLEPGYFKNQLKYFEKPDTFGVMGRIIGWDDDTIQDGAKFPHFHGVKIKTSKNYLLREEEKMVEGIYTFYLSGANAFIDKEKFLAIGGFNELFSPFYVEDTDLSIRAWRLGYKCYYDHSSICRHKTSSSVKSKDKKKFVKTIYSRNKFFMHALHLQGIKKLLWYMQWLPETLVQVIIGKFYLWQSALQFVKRSGDVKKSIKNFNALADKKGVNYSIHDVVAIIKNNIKEEAVYF